MTEQLPYPEAEQRTEPANLKETLVEELRLYGPGEDIRTSLDGLRLWYAHTPIMQSLRQFAVFQSTMLANINGINEPQTENEDFLRGEIAALHMHLKFMSEAMKGRVLEANPVGDLTDFSVEALDYLMDGHCRWNSEGYMNTFESMPEELQQLVGELAANIYDDMPHYFVTPAASGEVGTGVQDDEDIFIAGFMHTMVSLADYITLRQPPV